MGELFANNHLGKGVHTLLWPLQNYSFFCHFSSAYRHFLLFPNGYLFSNRLILHFRRLGRLKAPQCSVLTATWILRVILIALRTGFKSSRSMLRRVVRVKYRDLIHRWKEEHHVIMTEKEPISYIFIHCAVPGKKKAKNQLVYSVDHFSNSAFNNIWMCIQSADPIKWSIFRTPGGFDCVCSLLFLAKYIYASLLAGRSPEESRGEPASPTLSPNKALGMHQQLLWTVLCILFSPLHHLYSPCCILLTQFGPCCPLH